MPDGGDTGDPCGFGGDDGNALGGCTFGKPANLGEAGGLGSGGDFGAGGFGVGFPCAGGVTEKFGFGSGGGPPAGLGGDGGCGNGGDFGAGGATGAALTGFAGWAGGF